MAVPLADVCCMEGGCGTSETYGYRHWQFQCSITFLCVLYLLCQWTPWPLWTMHLFASFCLFSPHHLFLWQINLDAWDSMPLAISFLSKRSRKWLTEHCSIQLRLCFWIIQKDALLYSCWFLSLGSCGTPEEGTVFLSFPTRCADRYVVQEANQMT